MSNNTEESQNKFIWILCAVVVLVVSTLLCAILFNSIYSAILFVTILSSFVIILWQHVVITQFIKYVVLHDTTLKVLISTWSITRQIFYGLIISFVTFIGIIGHILDGIFKGFQVQTVKSGFVGEVGKNYRYDLTLIEVKICSNDAVLHLFVDEHGNRYKAFEEETMMKIGIHYNLPFKVVGHRHFNNVAETQIELVDE